MEFFQSFCLSFGKYGCYVLCILNVAEQFNGKKFNAAEILALVVSAIRKGYVSFDYQDYSNPDNFFVSNPDKLLSLATGEKWTVEKKAPSYTRVAGDYVVEQWSADGRIKHFARTADGFNSLQKSNCVSNGKIVGLRVFRRIK